MSITDELRKVAAKTECANGRCEKLYRGDLDHIADRIEEQVRREYIELPKDADGETIHLGDVMEWDNGTFTVHELKVTEDGWTTWDEQHGYTVHADECRHHHAPTVEDVLREFAEKIIDSQIPSMHPTYEEAIAEYAARLRLAGDE